MSERIFKQQDELAKLIERYSAGDGVHGTAIPSLFFIRNSSNIEEQIQGVYKRSLCIVAQGVKEVSLGQKQFSYSPTDYLVTSVDLPVTVQVIKASSDVPYLALMLEFTPSQVLEVLSDSEIQVRPKEYDERAMFVSAMELSLLDSVIRLVSLLDNPNDIQVLAPLFTKEIIYRVLQGQHGNLLGQIAIEGSAYQISNAIEYIKNNYDRSFQIEELAEISNMSVSAFHKHFKEITSMSPIQYQKQMRLHKARYLLLSESTDVTNVAFRVGYDSPSQFSREYSRMFGFSPIKDINRLRKRYEQRINI